MASKNRLSPIPQPPTKPVVGNMLSLDSSAPVQHLTRLARELGPEESRQVIADLRTVSREFLKQPEKPIETLRKFPKLIEFYSSCTADIENDGHRFGEDLSEADKKALIAFLATM